MKVSLIFALDERNAIGNKNQLPWPKMSADLKRFKATTLGHHVIMGRKTYESMGGELLGRKNIVVSRTVNYTLPTSIKVVTSLGDALKYARAHDETEAFVIGGAMLFKEAIDFADVFYLTRIHGTFEADTFLPELDMNVWKVTQQEDFEVDEKNPYAYSFLKLEKSVNS